MNFGENFVQSMRAMNQNDTARLAQLKKLHDERVEKVIQKKKKKTS